MAGKITKQELDIVLVEEIESGGGGGTAETTSYDNTDSGLAATNVKDAIDELEAEKVSSTNIDTILKLTQAEYDALLSAGTLDANTLYLIEG
jgi:hypothetical protein